MRELEERYPAKFEATAHHQFRHPGDISPASSLYQYFALATQRAVIGNLSYMYANVSHPSTPRRLESLLSTRDVDVLCLNDTDSDATQLARIARGVTRFANAYYPVAAPWEKK